MTITPFALLHVSGIAFSVTRHVKSTENTRDCALNRPTLKSYADEQQRIFGLMYHTPVYL